MFKRCIFLAFVCFLGLGFGEIRVSASVDSVLNKGLNEAVTTADHSRFAELDRPFVSGSEVTRACLKCHNQAASQVHRSIHWTWESKAGMGSNGKDKPLGKAHVVNNF